MRPTVVIVFGTYNRRALLEQCVASIRRSVGALRYQVVVVDGGSRDGSSEWLAEQGDVTLIQQAPPLTGAVAAFNLGFAAAVDLGAPYVVQLNDDLEFIGPHPEIACAVTLLEQRAELGAVAFESDRYGPWRFEHYHGRCYVNQGVFRRAAGMAAARAMGDPTGRAWWDRRFHTYAADTCLGLWVQRLGWAVHEGVGLRVHDPYTSSNGAADPLRRRNVDLYANSDLFAAQWGRPESVAYSRADAERFGGRLM